MQQTTPAADVTGLYMPIQGLPSQQIMHAVLTCYAYMYSSMLTSAEEIQQ